MKTLKSCKYFKIFFLGVSIALAGCSSMNSDFECPMKSGVMCRSLDEVNSMIDRGELPMANQCSCDIEKICNNNPFCSFPIDVNASCGQPLRYKESVMKIWMAPYEDKSGNYHQESSLFTVVKAGHWIGCPVKALEE